MASPLERTLRACAAVRHWFETRLCAATLDVLCDAAPRAGLLRPARRTTPLTALRHHVTDVRGASVAAYDYAVSRVTAPKHVAHMRSRNGMLAALRRCSLRDNVPLVDALWHRICGDSDGLAAFFAGVPSYWYSRWLGEMCAARAAHALLYALEHVVARVGDRATLGLQNLRHRLAEHSYDAALDARLLDALDAALGDERPYTSAAWCAALRHGRLDVLRRAVAQEARVATRLPPDVAEAQTGVCLRAAWAQCVTQAAGDDDDDDERALPVEAVRYVFWGDDGSGGRLATREVARVHRAARAGFARATRLRSLLRRRRRGGVCNALRWYAALRAVLPVLPRGPLYNGAVHVARVLARNDAPLLRLYAALVGEPLCDVRNSLERTLGMPREQAAAVRAVGVPDAHVMRVYEHELVAADV